MQYKEIHSSDAPMSLLLQADPSEAKIASYLNDAWCFAAADTTQILGVCVVKTIAANTAEIYNVAVDPNHQGCGIGTDLLRFVLSELTKKNITKVELSTGSFGYQLTYYQRLGFRVDCVVKDYFLINYPEPIIEQGIQHRDMLRLYVQLQ